MKHALLRSLSVLVCLTILAPAASGCGRRRVATPPPQTPPPQTQYVGSTPPPLDGSSMFTIRDIACQVGTDFLQVTYQGQMMVNGVWVGTVTSDGGFYGRSGTEIGRVFSNGQMVLQGVGQDAYLRDWSIVSPEGVIAYVDPNGQLQITSAGGVPIPISGITPDSIWTFLFAFSMYVTRNQWLGM